jgi:membrane protein implicated in regulation of membrane protease activity
MDDCFPCPRCKTTLCVHAGYKRVTGTIAVILGMLSPLVFTRDYWIVLFTFPLGVLLLLVLFDLFAKRLVAPKILRYEDKSYHGLKLR